MREHPDREDEYTGHEQAATQMEPDRLVLVV